MIDKLSEVSRMKARMVVQSVICAALLLVLTAPSWAQQCRCPGDCNGDGSVLVDELITAVRMSLTQGHADVCSSLDINRDEQISISELTLAVYQVLTACKDLLHLEQGCPCDSAGDCASGECQDDVCCDRACPGRCDLEGREGQCVDLLPLAAVCSSGRECQSGICEDTVCCSRVCDFRGASCFPTGHCLIR